MADAAPSPPLLLASTSPQRKAILEQLRIPFDVVAPKYEETNPELADAVEVVRAHAREKARSVADIAEHRPVLGVDTAVVLDGRIFGKPTDRRDAEQILSALSGKRHEVLTAVALKYEGRLETTLSASEVEFRELSPQEIREYAASGECDDKAGAYGIQGRAATFVREIRRSHSGIVGLPLYETARLLAALGPLHDRRNPD